MQRRRATANPPIWGHRVEADHSAGRGGSSGARRQSISGDGWADGRSPSIRHPPLAGLAGFVVVPSVGHLVSGGRGGCGWESAPSRLGSGRAAAGQPLPQPHLNLSGGGGGACFLDRARVSTRTCGRKKDGGRVLSPLVLVCQWPASALRFDAHSREMRPLLKEGTVGGDRRLD